MNSEKVILQQFYNGSKKSEILEGIQAEIFVQRILDNSMDNKRRLHYVKQVEKDISRFSEYTDTILQKNQYWWIKCLSSEDDLLDEYHMNKKEYDRLTIEAVIILNSLEKTPKQSYASSYDTYISIIRTMYDYILINREIENHLDPPSVI